MLVPDKSVALKLNSSVGMTESNKLCCVGCEIGKQISTYSINYYNGGSYPLPQTILVRP